MACQMDWICQVAPVPAVFGFKQESEVSVADVGREWEQQDGQDAETSSRPSLLHGLQTDADADAISIRDGTDPYVTAVGVFRGVARSWAPHALIAGLVRTVQSVFQECRELGGDSYCGADDVFPLIVYTLAHVGCDTISRRVQCASEAVDTLIELLFSEQADGLAPYVVFPPLKLLSLCSSRLLRFDSVIVRS